MRVRVVGHRERPEGFLVLCKRVSLDGAGAKAYGKAMQTPSGMKFSLFSLPLAHRHFPLSKAAPP